jgi:hypothetical protein
LEFRQKGINAQNGLLNFHRDSAENAGNKITKTLEIVGNKKRKIDLYVLLEQMPILRQRLVGDERDGL